jgi:hypothetical protein
MSAVSHNLQAREVVIIITGAHKASALQKCIEGGVNHMWTLSSLQMHPHPMIVVDEDATLELQVKTVKVRYDPSFRWFVLTVRSTSRVSREWATNSVSDRSYLANATRSSAR